MTKLHIELTNRCVLECPACPRTEWKKLLGRPVEKKDLDIDAFEKFLDCPGGRNIDHFLICGDYGDAIYYPHLFDFLKRFRNGRYYTLYTNGSRRDRKFWETLACILTEKDTVIFSIDGLEHNNHIYRRNSDWDSIMTGIDVIAQSPANLIWKTIVFSYNCDELNDIKVFAENKGAIFQAEKTHRYGDDSLRPPDTLVELNHVFQDTFVQDNTIEIDPACTRERTLTCDGYLFPCDWIRNPRTLYKSQLWKQKSRWIDQLNIQTTNYDRAIEIVADWADFVKQSSLDHSPHVDVLCKMKCRVGCQQSNIVQVL